MPEPVLRPEELACLRYLSRYVDAQAGPYGEDLLDRLATRGLVDKVRSLAFPVLGQPTRYRLTARGRALVNAADGPV